MNKLDKNLLISILEHGRIVISTDRGDTVIDGNTFHFGNRTYESDHMKVSVSCYSKSSDIVYRNFCIQCKTNLVLYKVAFLTDFTEQPHDFIVYNSFINAPTAAFIRYGAMGFYTGVENPFFSAQKNGTEIVLTYEPSLVLKAGEIYESEPQFLGHYECTGKYIKEKEPINIEGLMHGIRRPRFFNPCGEIGLDIAEINAMRKYVQEYYDVIKNKFHNILYFFFYPKKQWPETSEEVKDYIDTIDRFAEMSGDMIVFNPHFKTTIPCVDKPYWELAPVNSNADRILRYAQNKGFSCGYYIGCAFNGAGGNAALLPYMPHEHSWKKVDAFGNVASENCLGCDEYLDWWYTVQKNTIEKYDLGYWAWDPGPGNGNDCFATNHGHLPGKGEYKGWRNSNKLLARLKEQFPDLFLMSFYGRKEYGIWGFRYFSQHEVYWEQTLLFGATLHNDLHDDRINAHGTRLQNQWCMNFRFLPAQLGHGLVPRMGENCFDPMLDHAYDFGGFRYALLSAIACCGSVTHCTLPDKLENIPGYTAFYKKWIQWAKDNYQYCAFTKPIGDEVSNRQIDGFARIDRDKGQIFLFNSSPKVIQKKLPLNERIGLDTSNKFYLRILYHENMDIDGKVVQYRGAYRMNDILDIALPPYGAVVLELAQTECESISDIPRFHHTIDNFEDNMGRQFKYPVHDSQENITLNTHAVFLSALREVLESSHIEHESFLMSKIPEWHLKGMPFTFVSALPHRLILYIPFDGPKLPQEVRLYINNKEVPITVFKLKEFPVFHYAFVENYVKWDEDNKITLQIKGLAENSFMGIHVDYPDKCDGLLADEIVFQEFDTASNLHHDDSLVIDSLTVTPDILSDQKELFTVTAKTHIDVKEIEGIYYIHPNQPTMDSLVYNSELDIWQGFSSTKARARSIFCNSAITAWIKTKSGGIGPKKYCEIKIRYT